MDPPPYQGGPGIAPAGTAQYGGAQYVPQQGYPGYAPQPGSAYPGSNGAGYAPQPGSAYPGSNGAGYAPQPGSAYPGADGAGYAPPTVIIQPVEFGRFPVAMICPHCQQQIQTRLTYEIGLLTWIIGCFFCFLAFCIDACKDVSHSCPACNAFLGRKAAL